MQLALLFIDNTVAYSDYTTYICDIQRYICLTSDIFQLSLIIILVAGVGIR